MLIDLLKNVKTGEGETTVLLLISVVPTEM